MSRRIRTLLLTSTERRHAYVARALAQGTRVVGVVSEEKATAGPSPEPATDDQRVVASHFAERDRVEERLMGGDVPFPDVDRLRVPRGGSNEASTLEWVVARDPDAVVLFGTSIIKPPLLTLFAGRMINLHLGLSPYYRGSGTNFWPLVNGEPELVGATIHHAVASVDAGAILHQVRPEAAPTDRAHDLGTRTIMAAARVLPEVVVRAVTGELPGVEQDLSGGRLYRRRDFDADAVRTLWKNLEEGMMATYVDHSERRRQAYPIVEAL